MPKLKILLQSKIFIIISLIFLLGYVFLFTQIIKLHSVYNENIHNISGIIMDYKIDGDKLSITLKAQEKIMVFYYFKTEEEKKAYSNNLEIGRKIEAEGNLTIPLNNTIPNTFNYKKYLYSKKISWCMNATKITIKNNKLFLNYKIKNWIISRVSTFSKPDYLYAFILGKNSYIDNNIYELYQKNGVTHLFAVSGMHISFLILTIQSLLKKLKIKEQIIDLSIILFLVFYMFLIGFSASIVRASLLYICLLINRKSRLNLDNKTILYLILLILLIKNPFYIYDLGFLYSFTTSFGLIIFSQKITGNYLKKLLKTSSIAFLFSTPITLYYFYEINIMTIFNNLLIVPLVSLILFPLSLLTFIIPVIEPCLNMGITVLEKINEILNLFAINLVLPKINFIFLILYYFSIYIIYKYGVKRFYLFIFLFCIQKTIPYLDSNAYVYYLDVGQGDCALIITENRKDVIMIDTGGTIEYEKESWEERNSNYTLADNIITFLKSLGIQKINLLIITHGDYDHMGEARTLVESFKADEVIFNVGDYNDLEYELIKALDDKKISYYKGLNEINMGKCELQFLNTRIYDNENDNSNVIYLEINNYEFLFMGDAGIEKEQDILKKYKLNDIDFLKVGHHGSKTSSSKEFINEINPKYSIISVGKNNRYGHPNDSVLNNLKDSSIFRTDLNGSIEIKLMKNSYNIRTCLP